jgi:hypothetical protein
VSHPYGDRGGWLASPGHRWGVGLGTNTNIGDEGGSRPADHPLFSNWLAKLSLIYFSKEVKLIYELLN